MTLDLVNPFTSLPRLSSHPTIPPHLLSQLPTDERCARHLALLLNLDDPEIQDWAQAEYLKLGHSGCRLMHKGVFEARVTLEGIDENIAEDWSANKQEEDLEKLKEQLKHKKVRHEDYEKVEQEMV